MCFLHDPALSQLTWAWQRADDSEWVKPLQSVCRSASSAISHEHHWDYVLPLHVIIKWYAHGRFLIWNIWLAGTEIWPNTLLKDTTTEQIITDMRVGTRCPLVRGWSLHKLHSASLNTIDRERYKKKDICVCLHVGLMCMCAKIQLHQSYPLSHFLHVCSTCSSHVSANIYTECKTLLISLPCLFSCSFSQPTLALTFFHLDGEWQGGGNKESGGRKRASERGVRSGEERGSKEKTFGEERGASRGSSPLWWMTCHLIEIKSPIYKPLF